MDFIVSLTSFDKRINTTLPQAIKGLNNCLYFRPSKIVVYIAIEEKNKIDHKLFKNFDNVEFRFIKNYNSHKKFYALTEQEFMDKFVIIFDDDLVPKSWFYTKLFEKYQEHQSESNFIVVNRAQKFCNKKYKERKFLVNGDSDSGRMVFGSGSGILIPPYTFRFDESVIEESFNLTPFCDEQYYSLYCITKGIKTYCTLKPQPFTVLELPKENNFSLWANHNKFEKDEVFQKMIKHFDISPTADVFVSFTSWPKRIRYAVNVVKNMKKQTYKPKKIILTLSSDEFPNMEKDLPKELLAELDETFLIKWTDKNYYTMKKLFPLFWVHPEHWVLLVDDDIPYPNNFIETMVDCIGDGNKPITGSHLKSEYPVYGKIFSFAGAYSLIKPIHCMPILKDMFDYICEKNVLDVSSDQFVTFAVLKNGCEFKPCKTNYKPLAVNNDRYPEPFSKGKVGQERREKTLNLILKYFEQ